jgi:hypothetical protein
VLRHTTHGLSHLSGGVILVGDGFNSFVAHIKSLDNRMMLIYLVKDCA